MMSKEPRSRFSPTFRLMLGLFIGVVLLIFPTVSGMVSADPLPLGFAHFLTPRRSHENVAPLNINEPLSLGNYPDTSIPLSSDATVTPDTMPVDTTSINVSTSTGFNGRLEGDPASGMVRITDA